jgi:hypothetical protein
VRTIDYSTVTVTVECYFSRHLAAPNCKLICVLRVISAFERLL